MKLSQVLLLLCVPVLFLTAVSARFPRESSVEVPHTGSASSMSAATDPRVASLLERMATLEDLKIRWR